MLDQALKEQVKNIFSVLESTYKICIYIHPEHSEKNELVGLLNDVAECSSKISTDIIDGKNLHVTILKDNNLASFSFIAVPTGHEFSTLLLSIMNLDGKGKNLPEEEIISRIKAIKGNIHLKTYISLTCTNCPDVVQSLNLISIINPNIKHTIIDGALMHDDIQRLGIQAVPIIFSDDKQFHVGKASITELVSKLEDELGTSYKQELKTLTYDVAIIGAGPAGATAAIYAARKGFKVGLVSENIGGQTLETQEIENITSIPTINGTEFSANIRNHINKYNIDILENRKVLSTKRDHNLNIIHTSFNEEISTPALIIATGAHWRRLNIKGEDEYIGRGIAFCTHCDGPFYKDKKVIVVGGGNSGLEAAIDLSSIAKDVCIIEFADKLNADKILQNKIKDISNITTLLNTQTTEIIGDGSKLNSIKIMNRENGITSTISCDGVFIQIGLLPNSNLFKDLVKLNQLNEIIVDSSCRTSQIGIYAAGDVTNIPYKQIITASGDGAKAALSVFEDYIKSKI